MTDPRREPSGASPGVEGGPAPAPPQRDAWIGPYRVVGLLGRGGMGVVYAAERADGLFRRRVAVKVLKGEADPALNARIVAERQILASLDHPGIARLLDGGITDDGRPYLVMEHVSGLPIDVYCARMRLSVAERLRLFNTVARAVDHAHRNLIVHRDLKPSNILVSPAGEVKLLDFGIAKLLNPSLAGVDAPVTRTDHRVLTPEYASPEQVRGETLTTASDVYALGVVLYELLTGRRPYELAGRSLQEMIVAVCERDPERPSTAVARPAPAGDAAAADADALLPSPERLRRRLRGDLDAIVMMALRKEPGRRYGSAELLAQDIERHLDGRPVRAHRGTRRYRLGKFVRRHRGATLAAAVVVVSLLSGAFVATREAQNARDQRDRAAVALAQATEVTDFLLGLFESSDPDESLGETVTAADLLRRGALRADELSGQPVVQGRMFETMSRVHANLGRYEESHRLAERAVAVLSTALGGDDPAVATALRWLASPLRHRARYDSAWLVLEEARRIQEAALGPSSIELAATLEELGSIAIYLNRTTDAERLRRRAYEIHRERLGPDHAVTLNSLNLLGTAYRHTGRFDAALSAFQEAVTRRRALGSDQSRALANDLMMVGMVLTYDLGRHEDAEPHFRDALEVWRRTERQDPRRIGWALEELARLAERRGDAAQAERLLVEALDSRRSALGELHPNVASSYDVLGNLLLRLGRPEEARPLISRAAEIDAAIYGEEHPSFAIRIASLATTLERLGELTTADSLLRRAIDIRIRFTGHHPNLMTPLLAHARVLARLGRTTAADSALELALEIVARRDVAPPRRAEVLEESAGVYELIGRPTVAAEQRRRAAALRAGASGA